MRLRPSHVLLTTSFLLACSVGENSAGDNFTFGDGGEGDAATSVATDSAVDTSADGMFTGGTQGNTSQADVDTGNDDNADGVQCIDGDGDDYGDGCAAGPDCDDTNPEVNPGAAEACNGQDDNCDDEIDNGCECPDDGVSGACNAPSDLGIVEAGGSTLGVVGTVPQEGSVDWYTVSFPFTGRPGGGTPTISFAINEGEAFVFDVVAAECEAAGAPCGEGGDAMGTAVGLTEWTFADTDPGCCAPPADSMVAWPDQIWLRVYRTSMGASCDTYQLEVSR